MCGQAGEAQLGRVRPMAAAGALHVTSAMRKYTV